MKSYRKYKKVVAGFKSGSVILFEMENGYFYQVTEGDNTIAAFYTPDQLARFNPYLFTDDPANIPKAAINKAAMALQDLPIEIMSCKIKENPKDL